ncbi:hypothetical protein KC734_10990 [candidate division KSB1 bacterium]|nr:hypothetical protein [candidate division KSB1 bacterium]
MVDYQQEKELRQRIATWSDEHLSDARQMVSQHKRLLRELTNSQLYGLLNHVRNSKNVSDVRDYADRQARKAKRAGRQIEGFWLDFHRKIESFDDNVNEIVRESNSRWVNDDSRTNAIHLQLLRRFVQHLIAEKLVLDAQSK